MTAPVWQFTSTVVRPDGLAVTATVESPDRPDVQELAELAQVTASNGIRLTQRHDESVARWAARDAAEAEAEALANGTAF